MNMCVCVTKTDHTERGCACSCHARIRSEAAINAARTRRAKDARERIANVKRNGASMVEHFNKEVPVGSAVNLVLDDGSTIQTWTRSEAWQLGDGTPVVSVKGKSGGWSLARVYPR